MTESNEVIEKTVTANDSAPAAAASTPAVLVLEDGRIFRGTSYGATGTALGEAVFATGMTGYQETITDPSYARQLVVQTAPHIGNTGVNTDDAESRRIWVAGYVVRDAARRPSNWRSERSLDDELVEQGIVGIQGVDTRAITRHLREHKTMRAGIFSGDAARATDKELTDAVLASAPMEGSRLAEEVSVDAAYTVEPKDFGWDGEPRFSIAAIDLGIKRMTPVRFAERGVRVHVLPATATLADVQAVNPDGFFMSNGPGDPATADNQVKLLRSVLDEKIPYFGICFGNQILGRALGFGTYKLRYGHRGLNQPVMDRRTGQGRNHLAEPRLRRRRPAQRRHPGARGTLRPRRGQPREPQRRRRRRARLPRHPGVLRPVPPRSGRRPARRRVPLRPLHRAHGGHKDSCVRVGCRRYRYRHKDCHRFQD